MASQTCTNCCHTPPPPCCQAAPPSVSLTPSRCDTITDTAMEALKILVLLGLSGYAAYLNPRWFGYFCAGGFVIGLPLQYRVEQHNIKVKEAARHQPGCSQSLMGQLTGVKLPPVMQLGIDAALFYDHIRHHRQILVPITGFNFGTFIAKLLVQAIFACRARAH